MDRETPGTKLDGAFEIHHRWVKDQDGIELAVVGGGLEPPPLGPVLCGRDVLFSSKIATTARHLRV
ncbi:hypothetical protein ACMHYB_09410 [Sorangium sp. So ce1128]